jgi:hypothetical protein
LEGKSDQYGAPYVSGNFSAFVAHCVVSAYLTGALEEQIHKRSTKIHGFLKLFMTTEKQ